MPEIKIKNWGVSIPDPYCAPECRGLPTAVGKLVEEHRGYPANATINTSAIVKIEGRKIHTKSGSVYVLDGDPHPEWVKAMKREGYGVDLNNPLCCYAPTLPMILGQLDF